MKNYVVGFLFSENEQSVLLIEKQRPDWQKGLWNGIGGHIEPEETPLQAIVREFKEETGIESTPVVWSNFLTCDYGDCIVYFFRAFAPYQWLTDAKNMTDEVVGIWNLKAVHNSSIVISNLKWVIPLALDKYIYITKSFKL